jgi:hypothetical protein
MSKSVSWTRVAAMSAAIGCTYAMMATIQTSNAEEPAAVAAKGQATAKPIAEAKPAEPAPVEIAGVTWRTDYGAAYRAAKQSRRMLLINFVGEGSSAQQSVERTIAGNAALQQKLSRVVCARLPLDATITVDGKPQRLINNGAFAHLNGGPGFVLIDLRNVGQRYYGQTVSVLPYASGKYYHFQPHYLSVILDIPAGTLTQRTMIWAVRIHPENPQSTYGEHNPTLANGAAQHASYQANVGQQGHQNFDSRFHQLSAGAGGAVSEVCAESWPGQNMIDSCIDCVDSWRHSSGHWRGVSGRHRAFGYDIRRGRNGIWYGTGIFAN